MAAKDKQRLIASKTKAKEETKAKGESEGEFIKGKQISRNKE